ncbi:MAG TPA: response regulator transcription factor [Acidimicrobiales bacterium]|nr:response regulator transcription factor [Acidimicrobiales bacterium]
MKVLIVEDHELLAGTMAMALRQQGMEVHSTAGPTAAAVVELGRTLAPVLVLLDLELGASVGSGLDLIRPLTEAGARVVMVTGVTDRARLGACIEAGAVGVVSKAAEFSALIDTVHRAIRGAPLLSADERQALLEEARRRRRADRNRLAPFDALSPREGEVLVHLLAGESAETIAEKTYVSLATVRSHIRAILLKLGVNSQLAAVALARNAGWPAPEGER